MHRSALHRLVVGVRDRSRPLAARLAGRLMLPAEGQTTVEYALVMLGVAAIAGLMLGWVRGTDLFERLFDRIVKSVTP